MTESLGKRMRIIVAPDSYKGSLSAVEVAAAMARGIGAVLPDAEVVSLPVADGGEGTVTALVAATSGSLHRTTVTGPLGERVVAEWGMLGDGETAVIEMAAAAGLVMVPPRRRDPRLTTTRGVGELIRAALDRGARRLIIGLGGSATNDGGAGMARALGARFLDAVGVDLPEGGAALTRLARVDLAGLDPRLADTYILAACDVDNPLCGARGAATVYGPQKGATPAMVDELDHALRQYALVAEVAVGRQVAEMPGAGAAGGLGAGLLLFAGAVLRPGVEMVLDAMGFARYLDGADLVITGEGRTDRQTLHGKAPLGVARFATRHGVPVVCLSGELGEGADDLLAQGGTAVMAITPGPMTLEECMARAPELVESAASRLCRLLLLGQRLAQ